VIEKTTESEMVKIKVKAQGMRMIGKSSGAGGTRTGMKMGMKRR